MSEYLKLSEQQTTSHVLKPCMLEEDSRNLQSGRGDAWWWFPSDRAAVSHAKLSSCLEGKSILLVGDSITQQTAHAMDAWRLAAGINLEVTFVRACLLFNETSVLKTRDWNNLDVQQDLPWLSAVRRGKVDLLTINTGLWWAFTDPVWRKVAMKYREVITAVSEKVLEAIGEQSRLKASNVVWRTTAPRHFRDGEWDSPKCRCSTDQQQALDLGHEVDCGCCQVTQPDFSAEARDFANGGLYSKMNRALEQRLAPYPFRLLDIFALALPRQDNHNGIDCTHFCLPGIPDQFNLALFQDFCSPDDGAASA